MCARLELNDSQAELRQTVPVWLEEGRSAWLLWTGFARSESLHRWLTMGAQLVDIPARRFAIRSTRTDKIVWTEIPLGLVARGIIDSNSGRPLLKIVTRAAEPEEYARFEHWRLPVIELPRVSAERILSPKPHAERPVIVQPALFAF
jgi:hypothetical protein